MPFPIPRGALSETEILFFQEATNPDASTIERLRLAVLLTEATATAEGFVFNWSYELQVGWRCEMYVEPEDNGTPQFIQSQEGIHFNSARMERELERQVIEAQLVLSLMHAETWRLAFERKNEEILVS